MGFPRGNPLDEPAKLRTYRWPDPDDERIYSKIQRLKSEFTGGDVFLAGSHRDTLWEKTYMLVGMERAMEYFFTEPEFMREVFHRIMDFHLGIAKHYLAAGVETVGLSDDMGTQQGPLLGPELVMPADPTIDPIDYVLRHSEPPRETDAYVIAAMNADRDCPKCHGTGVYRSGERLAAICDACCKHVQGWWQLEGAYGPDNGRWACKAGCGVIVDTPIPDLEFLPRALA